MKIIMLSLDSATDAQRASLWNEVERVLGFSGDPLDELIAEEEGEFDTGYCVTYLNAIHRRAHSRDCSFPQCNTVCRACKDCAHRERSAR